MRGMGSTLRVASCGDLLALPKPTLRVRPIDGALSCRWENGTGLWRGALWDEELNSSWDGLRGCGDGVEMDWRALTWGFCVWFIE